MQLARVAATPSIGGPTDGAQDTYYVAVPFQSLIAFPFVFALFAAFYLWCERAWGPRYDDRLGQAHLGLTVAGVALLALPPSVLNFGGGLGDWFAQAGRLAWLNGASALGVLLLGCGILVFVILCLRGLWSALAVSGDAP
jgi:cytochrome c oxidase subunit 1